MLNKVLFNIPLVPDQAWILGKVSAVLGGGGWKRSREGCSGAEEGKKAVQAQEWGGDTEGGLLHILTSFLGLKTLHWAT